MLCLLEIETNTTSKVGRNFIFFDLFLNLLFCTQTISQIEYNLPEMLEIFEKMLKFDERVAELKQLRADHVAEMKEMFNEKIKKFQFESMRQFNNSMDTLVYDIVKKLADSKFIINYYWEN